MDTLEAALWAVQRTMGVDEMLVLAVDIGGDADTVGAVAARLPEPATACQAFRAAG